MLTTKDCFIMAPQGAAAIEFCCTKTLSAPLVLPELFATLSNLFAEKRILFLSLLRPIHINNLANELKQKVSLASHGCWIRKVQRHFVSDMWRSTLPDAFLFNNLVK